ncbi:outer membrane protein [Pontibacter ummariensis]|uniref:Outer membrane protein n=1 Tax=Pontibacter ummariensis TaxID=1610492 RepID=A0A239D964_9BACT|nr:TolC family protein [Pontibacter ummariensis]PRY14283.1 outer membrane protein [Pontibacter ummariensis]SNS28153.1 outer membrane protein [Pontibacter ummariensis]
MKNFTSKTLLQKLGGLALCLSLAMSAQAQESLTLEQSLELARQNNVALRQARYNSTKADINLRKNKFSYLPSISANTSVSRINGLTFDNTTGQLKRGNTTSSNPYLAGQLVIFDGMSKLYELKQAKQRAEASKYQEMQADIDLEANITGFYLQAVLDRENVQIAEERISLLQQQLDKMEKLERAGVRTMDNVYELKSQLATEKLNLITHQNNYRKALLALVQEMNVEGNVAYELEVPTTPLAITDELPSLEETLTKALGYSPMVKASAATWEATKNNLKIAKSNFSPTLSLEGMIGSNFSSNIVEENPETKKLEQIAYFDQLDLNQQKIVQLSLSIPIFNGLSRHFEAQTARLDMRNAELDYVAAQNTLRQTVHQAYQDVMAAREKYNTVVANLEYTEKAFESAKRRYEAGTIDFYAYMEALNNKNQSQTELLQSKLEFYFKQRILELYQG